MKRRQFLTTTTAALAGFTIVLRHVVAGAETTPPSIAVMGVCCAVTFGAVRLAVGDVRAPLMDQGPVIDGRIEADEWALSTGYDGFGGNDGELVQRRVRGYVGATLTHIYVAIKSRLPDEGMLLAAVERDSAKTVYDDDSGVGTQVAATDLNNDKVPDVMVGNKKGTFVFLSQPIDSER